MKKDLKDQSFLLCYHTHVNYHDVPGLSQGQHQVRAVDDCRTGAMISTAKLFFLGAFLSLGKCWNAPDFCRKYECPMYTLVNTYEGFEERLYNATQWITADITSLKESDVRTGFWKLYYFLNGENEDGMTIPMTTPVVLSVREASENGQKQASICFFITPDTAVLPKPNDESIKKKDLPSGTVYVRVFGGQVTEDNLTVNMKALKDSLLAAGKLFDDNGYTAAAYDPPWELLYRHNEVWFYAA